jgi:hypothetical protein
MAEIGDRVVATSKGAPRHGSVTRVSGVMITVQWDAGDETSLIPGPGVLRVERKAGPGKETAKKKQKK